MNSKNQGADQVSENPRAVEGEWKTLDRGFQQNVVDITTVDGRLLAAGVDNLAAENVVAFHNASLKDSRPFQLFLCEIPRLILHENQPYIFQAAPGCQDCQDYLNPPSPTPQASEVVEEKTDS